MFPRHVIEHMISKSAENGGGLVGAAAGTAGDGGLAAYHENVTVLFMDIVGELGHQQPAAMQLPFVSTFCKSLTHPHPFRLHDNVQAGPARRSHGLPQLVVHSPGLADRSI